MKFDAFLEQAWADHAERAEEVAQRLDQGYALIETPAQIAPLARILAHVDGEHLARWADGVARLERLRAHAQWRDDGEGAVVVRRLVAALMLGGGDEPATPMSAADRAQAHAVAASALAAQGRRSDAIRHFGAALSAAAPGIADGDPAVRALAVTSNNLAATLEELPSRDAEETEAMLDAARASREYWARAGGWLETERAEYMLAKCHLAAGDAQSALAHAEECAAICERNGADAFEQFFAQGMLALAHRARDDDPPFALAKSAALTLHATLAADQQRRCDSTLKLLA
ncbi:MAG: hypothetical protein ABI569_04165 [Casimicrobiaceae bacterium]